MLAVNEWILKQQSKNVDKQKKKTMNPVHAHQHYKEPFSFGNEK